MKTSKLFVSALVLMAGALSVAPAMNAQENGNRDENGKIVRGPYLTNRFGDNWFVGVGAGVNTWYGKGVDGKFGVATDIYVGKWLTPSTGIRGGWAGLKNKVEAKDGYTACDGTFNCNTVHVDFLWNLSNAFSGYKETRTWNVIVYPSFAYMRARGNNEFGVGGGLLNNFRLCDRVNLYLDLSVYGTKSDFPHVSPRPNTKFGVLPSARFGVAINLGKTGFKRHSSAMPAIVPVPFTEDQYNQLQNRVNALDKENKNLKDQVEDLKNVRPDTVTVAQPVEIASTTTLYFELGKAELTEREAAHFDLYVKSVLELEPDKVFVLTGSADKSTGSEATNQRLSEERANNVKKLLVEKYGVPEEHVKVKADGAKNNKYTSAVLNRVVTIE